MNQPARPSGPDSLKILVVDDEPAMVGALGALLGQAGHRIVAAYDGEEALRRFKQLVETGEIAESSMRREPEDRRGAAHRAARSA